jgi:hypothetical protein
LVKWYEIIDKESKIRMEIKRKTMVIPNPSAVHNKLWGKWKN